MKKNIFKTVCTSVMAAMMVVVIAGCASTPPPAAPAPAATPAPAEAAPADATPAEAPAETAWKPSGSVEIVVPYGAGGSSDLLGRAVEKVWSKYCDQPVIITNLPGGGGVTGSMQVANSEPNGQTLVLGYGSGCDMSMPFLQEMDYDPFKYLDPVALLSVHNVVLAALPDSGFDTIADVVQWSKDNGQPITVSSSTANGTVDLVTQAFKHNTAIDMNIVPHDGTASAITDLLSGAYLIGGAHPSDVLPFVESGQLKILGVAAQERDSALPDIPTFMETGIDFWAYGSIKGIAVPKNTSDEIKAYYEKLFADITSDEDFVKTMNGMGQPVTYMNTADFTKYFSDASAMYEEIINELGLSYK